MDAGDTDQPTAAGPAAWAGLGTRPAPILVSAELWWIDLPFRRPVTTSVGTHSHRPLLLVRLGCRTGARAVDGWGECAALGDTAYHDEDVPGAFDVLGRTLVPALVARAQARGGTLPGTAALGELPGARGNPMAFAALEMAVADAHLRCEGRSLADLLGVAGRRVPLGAVVGTQRSVDDLKTEVAVLADEGYTRLKLKIGPGWDLEPVAAVAALGRRAPADGEGSHPTRNGPAALLIQVDANGAYREQDADHLARLDRHRLLCLEQPLPPGDLEAHARLARQLATPICLDEDLDSPSQVQRAVRSGACSVVCVKPARLGGVAAALETIDRCTASSTPLWLGGMFESGYARGVNTALAALPGFSWPGDLSPARSYLAEDLVQAVTPDRRDPDGALEACLPTQPGMGPAPEEEVVRRRCVRRLEVPVDGA